MQSIPTTFSTIIPQLSPGYCDNKTTGYFYNAGGSNLSL